MLIFYTDSMTKYTSAKYLPPANNYIKVEADAALVKVSKEY